MRNESCKVYERYANTPSEVAQKLYYYPQWVGRFVCNSDFYIERADYESVLLLFTVKGTGKLIHKDNEYLLKENSLVLINCQQHHIYYPVHEWEFCFLHIKGQEVFSMIEYLTGINDSILFQDAEFLKTAVFECIELCKDKRAMYEMIFSKKISDMFYELTTCTLKEENSNILMACDYIARNFREDLSTEKLASICCFSRCHFSNTFKKMVGTTPHDYLVSYRIDKSKKFLQNHSVSEVAELIGFKDTGTFIRAFKRKEGITPLQYVKSICDF